MKLLPLLTAVLALLAVPVHAKPTPDEAERIIDYYFNGAEQGPLLVDFRLCAGVHAEGDMKNECTVEYPGNRVTAGDEAVLWMKFLVPSETERKALLVQLNFQGLTLQTERVRIAPSLRYRTWTRVKLDKTGTWEVKILEDRGDSIEQLGSATIDVMPPGSNP